VLNFPFLLETQLYSEKKGGTVLLPIAKARGIRTENFNGYYEMIVRLTEKEV